jgi:hypothetical protein
MIVQAAAFGHCLMPDALLALNTLLQNAGTDLAALKVRGTSDRYLVPKQLTTKR